MLSIPFRIPVKILADIAGFDFSFNSFPDSRTDILPAGSKFCQIDFQFLSGFQQFGLDVMRAGMYFFFQFLSGFQ